MEYIKKFGPLLTTKLKIGLATKENFEGIKIGYNNCNLNTECEPITHIYEDCFQTTQQNATSTQHKRCLEYCIEELALFKELCKSFTEIYPNDCRLECNGTYQNINICNSLYKKIMDYCKTNNYFNFSETVKIKIIDSDEIGPHYRPDEKTFIINKKRCHYFHPSFMNILLCHECDPGHHYMNVMCKKFPSFKNNDNIALIEGWGFYSERFIPESASNYYAYCCSKCLHLIRAITDIHYTQLKDWNKNESIQFIKNNWPFPITDEEILEEIQRINDRPGTQSCYAIGERFFDQCLKTYSNRYNSLIEYHNILLESLNKCNDCTTQNIEKDIKL